MSEHMSDSKFGKIFAGMISGMVLLTIVLIILAYAVGGKAGSQKSDIIINAANQEAETRTTPVASIAVGEVSEQEEAMASAESAVEQAEQEVAAADSTPGQGVYDAACSVCHAAGVAGAPKWGDVEAWQPRIAQGIETLYQHSINGFNAMPAKGGNTALSDDDVKAAVDYMVNALN